MEMALSARSSYDRCSYLERMDTNLNGVDHRFDCSRYDHCSADTESALNSFKNVSRGVCSTSAALIDAENELRRGKGAYGLRWFCDKK